MQDKNFFFFDMGHVRHRVNPFLHQLLFLRVYSTILKTLREKEKFTNLENFLPFSSNLALSSANSFSLEVSKICCLGKG